MIGVVALLAAVLLPALAAARERGRRSACLSNVRQLGAALLLYTQDADGIFPPRSQVGPAGRPDWDDDLLPYAPGRGVFRCPDCLVPPGGLSAMGAPSAVANGYAFNYELSGAAVGPRAATAEATVPFPATTVAFCVVSLRTGGGHPGEVERIVTTNGPDAGGDLSPGQAFAGGPGAARHGGGSDYGFVDGHARWYRPAQVSPAQSATGERLPSTGSVPSFAR